MVTTERKLRRQTMMPKQAAATIASPSQSQRRTRRQSMMPVKIRSPLDTKAKVTKAKPSALPTVKSKRKLAEEIVTLEESPVSKKRRVAPISKSSTQVKTAASPSPSKKHKSTSALQASRITRKAQSKPTSPSGPPSKTTSPSGPPLESSRRKTPARKRALSPAKATPSPPKRRATSRSKSESHFVRSKSLTRSQKKATAPISKSSTQIKSPVAKKLDPSPKTKPDKKQSAASLKGSPKSPASPARKKAASTTTPKKTVKTGVKKMASPSAVTPPAPPPSKSAKRSLRRPSRTATKETVQSPTMTPASKKKTPSPKSPPSEKKTPTKIPKASKKKSPAKTPDAKSPASKKKADSTSKSPSASKKKTPKSPSASKKKTPTKSPSVSKKKTPTKTPSVSKKKTPTKTPEAKSPGSKKKTPSTSAKTPPTKKTPTSKTPKKTPTTKSPPSQKKSQKKTPTVVAKKVKTPTSAKKRSLSSAKVASPKSPPLQKRRLVRSTAKSHMSDIKTKSLRVVLHGISPPPSMSSFRKTPSSKRAPNATPPEDLGESPDLPSAHKQLKRIRENIATAHERRRNAGATPRKSLLRTANKTAVNPTLGKVVTQADIHATATDKSGSDGTLANHCDSSILDSTPSTQPLLPATPKSSKATNVRVCHFSSRITSSASVQRLTRGAVPQSSTPIKVGAEDSTTLSDTMDDSVDSRRADTSLEGMNGVEEDSGMDESVETQEAEPATQSRRSYCSLM